MNGLADGPATFPDGAGRPLRPFLVSLTLLAALGVAGGFLAVALYGRHQIVDSLAAAAARAAESASGSASAIGELQELLQRSGLILVALAIGTLALVVACFVAVSRRLVRELERTRAAFQQVATTDALTGLLNRQTILQRLDVERARHIRNGRPLSLAMVDLDHFMEIADELGRSAGDAVLAHAGTALQADLRSYDLVGRFGGEEFLLVLPETGAQEALRVAERVRKRVASEVRVGSGGNARGVTASFGVATLRQDEEIGALVDRADAALHRARAGGRNRVALDPPDPPEG